LNLKIKLLYNTTDFSKMQGNKKFPSFLAFTLFFTGIISNKFFSNFLINSLIFLFLLLSPLKYLSLIPLGNMHIYLNKSEKSPVYTIINRRTHKYMVKKIKEVFDGDTEKFLLAILLGERSEIQRKYGRKFIKTGTLHFLAISGLHMTIITSIFTFIFLLLRFNFKASLFLSLLSTFFYITLIPLRPSVLRAFIMILFFIFTYISNNRVHPLSILGNSGLISLLIFPEWAFDPGFHLSYLATFGIIILFPFFNKLKIKNYILRNFIYLPFCVSLSAQIFVFPYIYLFFKNIPLIAPLANLLLSPLVFLSLLGGLLTLILNNLLPFISTRIAFFTEFITGILFNTIDKLSEINFYIYTKKVNLTIFLLLVSIPLLFSLLKYITREK